MRKSTTKELPGQRDYKSTLLKVGIVAGIIFLFVFSVFIFPGIVSTWRSGLSNDRAVNFYEAGDLKGAKDELVKAVSLNRENAVAHYNLGLVLLATENNAEGAAAHFRRAVWAEPGFARAYHNLGVIELFYMRRTSSALDNLRRAAALDEKYAPTHLALGYLYEYTGEYGKAREEFELCVSAAPAGLLAKEAKTHLAAIAKNPLVDDLTEKMTGEDKVHELLITGDIYLEEPSGGTPKTHYPLWYISPVLSSAPFSAANLVTPASKSESGPAGKKMGVPTANPTRVSILADAGFDAVSILSAYSSNNPAKLEDTLRYLQDYGLECAGAGSDLASALKPVEVHTEDITVRALAFADAGSGVYTAGAGRPGCASLDSSTAYPAVAAASGADIVVVLVRWGLKAEDPITDETRYLARGLVDAGADIVAATGGGTVRPVEIYEGAVIAYGLPDFLPPPSKAERGYTQILAVEYSPVNRILGYRLVPAYVENTPLPLTGEVNGSLLDARLIRRVSDTR